MGQANNNWQWLQDAGKWVGGKIEDFTSWVGGLGQKFYEPEREAALQDQESLMQTQLGLNKQAAEHGHQLQKEMIDYTSPAMQMERLKTAGLNPALIYGGGGGVSGQSVGSQSTSGVTGHSSDAGARMMAKNQQMGMALQLAKLKSEIDVNKSVAEVNKASAGKQTSEKTTIDDERDILIAKLREEGINIMIENTRKYREDKNINSGDSFYRNDSYKDVLGDYEIMDNSETGLKSRTAILNTIANTYNLTESGNYNKEKADNYLKELFIAQQHGNAAETQAAAAKLLAEFNTGTDVNWKNISELALRLIQALAGLKPKGGITINK
nr:MAG: DNA pilot protein [Microvirus sp.]